MAGNLSNYAEREILDHSVGKTAWTMPTIHVGLFTTLPTDSTEAVSGAYAGEPTIDTPQTAGKYVRIATSSSTWGAASSSGSSTTTSNILAITFPAASGSWGEIVGVGLFDAATGGNLIWWGPLTAPKTVANGDVFQFGIGALTLSLD